MYSPAALRLGGNCARRGARGPGTAHQRARVRARPCAADRQKWQKKFASEGFLAKEVCL
jgi:hypothetical protein